MLGQLVLHVGEEKEKTTYGVPQPGMGQSLLILGARSLDDLGQGVEDLAGYTDGLEEIGLTGRIDELLARVVPVKVHNGLLKTQQVVNRAYDHVYGRRVTGLSPQVVLPI